MPAATFSESAIPAFRPYQAVTLIDDSDFLGYIVGRMVDKTGQPDGRWMVGISRPGKTGLIGDRAFEFERLQLLNSSLPKSAPIKQRKEHSNPRYCARRRGNPPSLVSSGEIIPQLDLAKLEETNPSAGHDRA